MPMRRTAEHLAPDGIEDDIYASQRLLDSLCFVVHNALSAQRGEVLPIRGATDDVNAGLAGQLEGVSSNIARGPDNERGLAASRLSVIEEHLPSGDRIRG
jgi:hypothetical protein